MSMMYAYKLSFSLLPKMQYYSEAMIHEFRAIVNKR